MKKWFGVLFVVGFVPGLLSAQDGVATLTLEYCYEQVYQNYPAADKADIQREITDLNRRIAQSGWYPDVQISGSTSYQSDVIEVPFAAPGTSPPEFSHDHYNLSIDVNQTIFDGGRIESRKTMEEYTGSMELARIETELWSVRHQVGQVYFGILKMQKQQESLELLLDDINEQLGMVQAQVRNGVLLPGDERVLRAEQIRVQQQITEVEAEITSGYRVLSTILGETIPDDTSLSVPELSDMEYRNSDVNRAEYDVFGESILSLDSQKEFVRADKLPSVSAFAKTAYSRPGLDAFDDDLQLYWVVGLRAQWSLTNSMNASKKMEVLESRKQSLNASREAFSRQLQSSLRQIEERIEMLRDQLVTDEEVLELREQITAEKRTQLERGAITSTQYMTELNAENRARVDREIRQILLVQAITEYATQKGVPWN
ncbi:MAG: TolC family protein [Balneolaceae bacterium]